MPLRGTGPSPQSGSVPFAAAAIAAWGEWGKKELEFGATRLELRHQSRYHMNNSKQQQ